MTGTDEGAGAVAVQAALRLAPGMAGGWKRWSNCPGPSPIVDDLRFFVFPRSSADTGRDSPNSRPRLRSSLCRGRPRRTSVRASRSSSATRAQTDIPRPPPRAGAVVCASFFSRAVRSAPEASARAVFLVSISTSSKFTDVSGGNRANPSAPADQAWSKYQPSHRARRPARPAARWRCRSDESRKQRATTLLGCYAMFAARHFASQILEIGGNSVRDFAGVCNDPRSSPGFRQTSKRSFYSDETAVVTRAHRSAAWCTTGH